MRLVRVIAFVGFIASGFVVLPDEAQCGDTKVGLQSVSPPKPAIQLLFRQPVEKGVAGHLLFPSVSHRPQALGSFALVGWQPNPITLDGSLVPSRWRAGEKTGFFPSGPLNQKQLSFADKVGSTTAQIDADTIGVFLNSADLPSSTHRAKMMIAPSYVFAKNERRHPFSQSSGALHTQLELQIPTAIDRAIPGSDTYVVAEYLFRSTTGTRISFGITLFFDNVNVIRTTTGVDTDSSSVIITAPLIDNSVYVTKTAQSLERQDRPWRGWRLFDFLINQHAFSCALVLLHDTYPKISIPEEPSKYELLQFHLNAELHFADGPSKMGWSMRGLEISLE